MPKRPSLPRPHLSRPRLPKITKPSLGRPRLPGRPHLPAPMPPSLWSDGARRGAAGIALLLVAAIGVGAGYLIFGDGGGGGEAPAPTSIVVDEAPDSEAAASLGFPAFATVNTTRVGGADPIADAAAVALATFPSTGGAGRATAAVIVPEDSWQTALAAAPLLAPPIAAPALISTADEVPEATAAALGALAPAGLDEADGTQAFVLGGAAAPGDLDSVELDGADPAAVAEQVDAQRTKIDADHSPEHLLVVSSSDAALAMPGAAWSARSGDPLLFADGDGVPDGTIEVVRRYPKAPIYVLGPESAISDKAIERLRRAGGDVTRVGAEDPVENAIALATFADGSFGWNLTDPGHGMAIANLDRPLDAIAAAPLAAAGTPGPLLLTDDAGTIPDQLRDFLAGMQPGYVDDPTRAVYNRAWVIGSANAISVPFQAQVDELINLVPVGGGG